MDDSTLARVEAQRAELEASIAKLKKSLRHWQALELDYEGLREEFQLLPDDSSPDKCLQVARDFGAHVVDEKDLQSLLKDGRSSSRSPPQLAHLLSKRVDYVARNAEAIRKQLSDAEKKRNALLLAEDPEHRDEAGLPLTEITEELDESGNIISTNLGRPGGKAAELVDVLEKAGVHDMKEKVKKFALMDPTSSERATAGSSTNVSATTPEPPHDDTFDRASSVDEELPLSAAARASQQAPASNLEVQRKPLNPFDTADEARLREEMLKYSGLDEVGAIVAELDLAEGASDVSYDPDDDDLLIGSDFEDEDEDDEEESEDETGKSKSPAISAAYKRKMEELEKSLGLKDMKNLGPDPELPPAVKKEFDRPPAAEAAGKAAISRQEKAAKSSIKSTEDQSAKLSEKKPKKKSVAFADSLNIATEEPAQKKQKLPSHPKPKSAINPIGESVIERTDSTLNDAPPAPAPAPPPALAPKRLSRFKKDKQAASNPLLKSPQPPKEQPLISPTIFERPSSNMSQPPDPDSIDDELHRREVALEYHKLRNRRIHQQGGFVPEDEEEEDFDDAIQDYGVVDPETGKMRKVSRFKAVRLKG